MLLTLFPQLLFLAPLGTTLLRVAAAICFAYMVWYFSKEQDKLTTMKVPLVGQLASWMINVSSALVGAIAVFLFLGISTQVIAILGALVVIKQLLFFGRYKDVFPFSRSTYWLLLCICLMLVVTGAGAFAFDLPL